MAVECEVVIAAGARTPFGRFGGALRDATLPDLARTAGAGALERAGVEPAEVDRLVLGVNLPGSDRSIARQTQLKLGIPDDRSSFTVDRACCSSLAAVAQARQAILLGGAEITLAGGSENLSLVPYFVHDMRWGKRLGPIQLDDQLVISCPYTHVPRAVQASEQAKEYGISRADQDAWALRSQQRAASAIEAGLLAEEIVPVDGLEVDESPRPQTTAEALASLATVNGSETVTAGNAPGMSTGASMLTLMSAGTADERGAPIAARIIATAMASGPPAQIASIPAIAAGKVLAAAGLSLADISLIEVNEAFAVVPLVTSLVLAESSGEDVEAIRERINVNGGAVALGHPTGATGGRLLLTIAAELGRRGGGFGLVTICGGIGEAESVLLEVPQQIDKEEK